VSARFTAARYDRIAERLGYRFKDKALLRHALTHSSAQARSYDYERLEFLGDRVLALVVAERLFRLNPGHREGHLAGLHSQLVRGETCASVGRMLALDEFIVVGQAERSKGLSLTVTVLGDVMEALIAAIYLDGGLEPARDFILRNWEPFFAAPATGEKDAKTFLQEWALARSLPLPAYRLVGREGPEHAPRFVVTVEIKNRTTVEGTGSSKRGAEQDAAAHFLRKENIRA
jgi:ribonuclease-3